MFAHSPPTTTEEFLALGHIELVPELAGLRTCSDDTVSSQGLHMGIILGVENLNPCLGIGNVTKSNQMPSFIIPTWV